MPPGDEDAMPRPELHAADNHTTAANNSACSYPLETLMALQKLLEGGIPEHRANPAPPAAAQSTAVRREARHSYAEDLSLTISAQFQRWTQSIKAIFTRGSKSKSSGDKGNSAQQTG